MKAGLGIAWNAENSAGLASESKQIRRTQPTRRYGTSSTFLAIACVLVVRRAMLSNDHEL
jgi:hypothetical protein